MDTTAKRTRAGAKKTKAKKAAVDAERRVARKKRSVSSAQRWSKVPRLLRTPFGDARLEVRQQFGSERVLIVRPLGPRTEQLDEAVQTAVVEILGHEPKIRYMPSISTRGAPESVPAVPSDQLRKDLVARLSPSIEQLDPVPHGLVEQSRRFSQLAGDLMKQGAFDYEALADAWDVGVDTARKRVLRATGRHELFTATYKERTFVPSFVLTERLEPRAELAPILDRLISAGDSGFSLWAWLTTPSSWLDGAVPHELARSEPERVERAAEQRALAAV